MTTQEVAGSEWELVEDTPDCSKRRLLREFCVSIEREDGLFDVHVDAPHSDYSEPFARRTDAERAAAMAVFQGLLETTVRDGLWPLVALREQLDPSEIPVTHEEGAQIFAMAVLASLAGPTQTEEQQAHAKVALWAVLNLAEPTLERRSTIHALLRAVLGVEAATELLCELENALFADVAKQLQRGS